MKPRKRSDPSSKSDRQEREKRSANALRVELLRRARSSSDLPQIELATHAFAKLMQLGGYIVFAGRADNSPSAEMLRQAVLLSRALGSLGYLNNASPEQQQQQTGFPKLIINDMTKGTQP